MSKGKCIFLIDTNIGFYNMSEPEVNELIRDSELLKTKFYKACDKQIENKKLKEMIKSNAIFSSIKYMKSNENTHLVILTL